MHRLIFAVAAVGLGVLAASGPAAAARVGRSSGGGACAHECTRWRSDQRTRCGVTGAVWVL